VKLDLAQAVRHDFPQCLWHALWHETGSGGVRPEEWGSGSLAVHYRWVLNTGS